MGLGSTQNAVLVKQKLDSGCSESEVSSQLLRRLGGGGEQHPVCSALASERLQTVGCCQGLSLIAVLQLHPFCCVTLSKLLNLPVALCQNANHHCTSLLGFSSCEGLYRQMAYRNA